MKTNRVECGKAARHFLYGLLTALIMSVLLSACASTSQPVTPAVETPAVATAAPEVEKPSPPPEEKSVPPKPVYTKEDVPPSAESWSALILRLANDGFDIKEISVYFSGPAASFNPAPMDRKLRELHRLLYKSERTLRIQIGLTELGYTPGGTDGRAGDNTRRAIKAFQQVHGIRADGEPSDIVLKYIEADLRLPPSRRPAPRKTPVRTASPNRVYKGYLTRTKLAEAENYMVKHQGVLKTMNTRFDVPGEFVVGILRVETNLGTYLGKENAFFILASMAACSDFNRISPYVRDLAVDKDQSNWLAEKAEEKADWAYDELKALLRYSKAIRRNPTTIPGSIYGAIGIGQFMPTNAIKYGVDGNGDGMVDLFDTADAIHSIGCYFKNHGWNGDMTSRSRQEQVIKKYNRNTRYVNTVMAVAVHLKNKK